MTKGLGRGLLQYIVDSGRRLKKRGIGGIGGGLY